MTIDPSIVIAAIAALSAGLGRVAWMIYLDLRRDRDFYRDRLFTALEHADRAVEITEKVVPRDA